MVLSKPKAICSGGLIYIYMVHGLLSNMSQSYLTWWCWAWPLLALEWFMAKLHLKNPFFWGILGVGIVIKHAPRLFYMVLMVEHAPRLFHRVLMVVVEPCLYLLWNGSSLCPQDTKPSAKAWRIRSRMPRNLGDQTAMALEGNFPNGFAHLGIFSAMLV